MAMQKNNSKFKETEIGTIPEKWSVLTIPEISQNFDSKRRPLSSAEREKIRGHYPYYGAAGIIDRVNDYVFDGRYLLVAEDGTVTDDKGYPTLQLTDGKFWVSNHAHILQCKNFEETRFLYYVLKNKNIIAFVTGAVQPKLNQKNLNSILFPYPTDSERIQILEILSSLDDKIELNRKINANLEKLAGSLFKKWFVDIGDELPNGWRTGSIGHICDFNPTYVLEKNADASYVEMKDLSENDLNIKSVTPRKFAAGSKFKNGDTLLARITPCLENGKTGYVNFLREGEVGWGSTEFIIMHPRHQEYTEFLYILARTTQFREYAIQSMSGSSGRQRVQVDKLVQYELVIPDEKTVCEYHRTINAIFLQLKFNNDQNKRLTEMRDSLLPRLMNGKIRVN